MFILSIVYGCNNDAISYEKLGVAEKSISELKPILEGGIAPDFTATDQLGNTLQLSEMLKDSSVVLVFYRGYWCPYCTRHLSAFAEQLGAIQSKGAKVIAVAPEAEKYRAKTVAALGTSPISVISDSNYSIMQKYGIAFEVNDSYKQKFIGWNDGLTLAEVNGSDTPYLPVPATYVIGKDGKVKWLHFDPNYVNRSSVEAIIKHL